MSNMKFVLLCNVIVKCVFAICITVAAIYFRKPSMCWWYVFAALLEWEYKGVDDG